MDTSRCVTELLDRARGGDAQAAGNLFTRVYADLRAVAQARMNGERADHTLQATALVHEAFVRLIGDAAVLQSDERFFAAAAEAMRRILIEHARARGRLKRGGDGRRPARRVSLSAAEVAADEGGDEQILMLDEALRRLDGEDPEAARVVRLRFYAGLTGEQAAAVLGLSPSTVDREWSYARARLYRLMSERG